MSQPFRSIPCPSSGYGILVSNKIKETAASFTVRSPSEVGRLLRNLVEWAVSEDNGWHTTGDKTLWKVRPSGASTPVTAAEGASAQAGAAATSRRAVAASSSAAGRAGLDSKQQEWQAWQNQVAQGQQETAPGLGP